MARKAETLWEVKKERRVSPSPLIALGEGFDDYIAVRLYALRADGRLLEKLQTKNLNGSTLYDYGWKLSKVGEATDRAVLFEQFKASGFTVVSDTPNAKLKSYPGRRRRI